MNDESLDRDENLAEADAASEQPKKKVKNRSSQISEESAERKEEGGAEEGGAEEESSTESVKKSKSKKAESADAKSEENGEVLDSANRGTGGKDWYILKVQVNREDSIKDNLVRRIKMTGLERFFDEILVPTEKVTTVKNGKKRVTKRKLYPGYLMVNMEINDETWFLVRETSGIGDFTGAAGKPVPMLPHEVQRILQSEKADTGEAPKLKVPYEVGDMVKITDGTFKETEGEVASIDTATGRITVNITIFARTTPIELEYWQVEKVG